MNSNSSSDSSLDDESSLNWFALVLVLSLIIMILGYRCYSWVIVRSDQ